MAYSNFDLCCCDTPVRIAFDGPGSATLVPGQLTFKNVGNEDDVYQYLIDNQIELFHIGLLDSCRHIERIVDDKVDQVVRWMRQGGRVYVAGEYGRVGPGFPGTSPEARCMSQADRDKVNTLVRNLGGSSTSIDNMKSPGYRTTTNFSNIGAFDKVDDFFYAAFAELDGGNIVMTDDDRASMMSMDKIGDGYLFFLSDSNAGSSENKQFFWNLCRKDDLS